MSKKRDSTLKAVVAVAVAFCLLFSASVIANDPDEVTESGVLKQDIKNIQTWTSSPTLAGADIMMESGEGDDILPSITMDADGHFIVTWTNMPSFSESNWGIAYAADPIDPWTSYVLTMGGTETHFDTAHIVDQDGDYNGLMGVYIDYTNMNTGYYLIPDITVDPGSWDQIFYWEGDGTEVDYACIDDSPFYVGPYYPQYAGPFNFYVYHFVGSGYDIPHCPVFFRTDVRGGAGGVSFFDAQEYEKTAPAQDPDLAPLSDRIHTVIENFSSNAIIWKMIVPAEEPDYEYTPYQDTIGEGTCAAIEAFEDGHVAVVYENSGEILCTITSDHGAAWTTPTAIATGEYPDICKLGADFWVGYVEDDNVFVMKSTDYGATWGEPMQMNDEDGTVFGEPNCIDMHESGMIAWEDERGEDIDIYTDLFFSEPRPLLKATLEGKAGTIENAGDADATNVEWSIDIEGSMVWVGAHTEDTIATIAPDETVDVAAGFVLGFGAVTIDLDVSCAEGRTASAESEGTLILFLLL